jgi:hypothetical protein
MIGDGKNRSHSGQGIKSNRSAAQSDERGEDRKHHHTWLRKGDKVRHTPTVSQRMSGIRRQCKADSSFPKLASNGFDVHLAAPGFSK